MIYFTSTLPAADLARALAPLCYTDCPDAHAAEVPHNAGTKWDLCDFTNDFLMLPAGHGRWQVIQRYNVGDAAAARVARWTAKLLELGASIEPTR
jgi:hypothetical protein